MSSSAAAAHSEPNIIKLDDTLLSSNSTTTTLCSVCNLIPLYGYIFYCNHKYNNRLIYDKRKCNLKLCLDCAIKYKCNKCKYTKCNIHNNITEKQICNNCLNIDD